VRKRKKRGITATCGPLPGSSHGGAEHESMNADILTGRKKEQAQRRDSKTLEHGPVTGQSLSAGKNAGREHKERGAGRGMAAYLVFALRKWRQLV